MLNKQREREREKGREEERAKKGKSARRTESLIDEDGEREEE